MQKKLINALYIVIIISIIGGSFSAFSNSGVATVEVLEDIPTTISYSKNLSFGQFYPSTVENSTTTITFAVNGNIVVSGETNGFEHKGEHSLGEITINGNPNRVLSRVLITGTALKSDGKPNIVYMPSLINDQTITNSYINMPLDDTGSKTLKVGGSLRIAGKQPAGQYAGTFSITVNN